MKSDNWFYTIFRNCPWLCFRLLGLPESQAADYRFGAAELKETSMRLDGILSPERPDETYYFLEAQLYRDVDFYRKWLAKIQLYVLQYRIEGNWRGLVLFGSRSQEPSLLYGVEEWVASGRIQRVYLDELPEYPEASLEVAVLKLAVTSRESLLEKARELVTLAKNPATNLKEPNKLLGIVEAFIVSNFPRLTREEILTMLQLNDIHESTIFQEGLQEGIEKGFEKGIEKGIEKGMKEGVDKGKQEGKLEEKLAIIALLYSKGRPVEEICDLLNVDGALVKKALAPRQQDS